MSWIFWAKSCCIRIFLPYNLVTVHICHNCSTKCPFKSFWALIFNQKDNIGCCPTQHLLFGNLRKYLLENLKKLKKTSFDHVNDRYFICLKRLNRLFMNFRCSDCSYSYFTPGNSIFWKKSLFGKKTTGPQKILEIQRDYFSHNPGTHTLQGKIVPIKFVTFPGSVGFFTIHNEFFQKANWVQDL